MAHKNTPTLPQISTTQPSPLFAKVLRESSNYEMAWLWAATQLTRPEEQRYCLERALYINPQSRMARFGLRELRCADRTPTTSTPFRFLTNLAQRLFGAGL